MQEPLKITLADAVTWLGAEGISYALIGGLAVSLRGQPRLTADVDLVIDADVDRALALIQALEGTTLKPLFHDVADVVQRSFILPLRHRTTHVKVDLALGLSGFERQALVRATPIEMEGFPVAVATVEDLLIMKALAGRPQDDQDARGLVIAQGTQLDWDYCLHVAKGLGDVLGQNLVGRISALRGSVDFDA